MRWSPLLVIVAACGSSSSAPDAQQRADAQVRDAPAADAPAADGRPPACDLSQPFQFGSIVYWPEVATPEDEMYVLPSPDLRTIFVTSNRPDFGDNDVYVQTRAFDDGTFGAAIPVDELNTPGQDLLTWLSPDGLTGYLARDTPGPDDNIYVTTRADAGAHFSTPALVDDVSDSGNDIDPFLAASGALYFASNRSGDYKIYRAAPTSPGHFATPDVIHALDTAGSETKPVLTDDELTIYFTRDGLIYVAHRASTASTFDTPTVVDELGGEGNNYVSWLSGDGCQVLFTSDGVSGPAGLEPFLLSKPPL